MPSKPEERLDRRDFMIASIATIGASAALVANPGSANAPGLSDFLCQPGTGCAISKNSVTAPSRHAGLLFNRLLRPNADAAVDFHTGTTGFDVTAFGRPDLRQSCVPRGPA